MKYLGLLSLAVALTTAVTGFTASAEQPDVFALKTASPGQPPQLSPAVRGVVEMVKSGVDEDVIKAYIQSAPSSFNLSSDDIILLQDMGISGTLTAGMLNHDKALRDNPGAYAQASSPPAVTAPLVPGAATTPPVHRVRCCR